MNNHLRLICGIGGVILLGFGIAWLGQSERQKRQQQLESTATAIGTPTTSEQVPGRALNKPSGDE